MVQRTRDFIYLDDVVDATILGIEKDEANGDGESGYAGAARA